MSEQFQQNDVKVEIGSHQRVEIDKLFGSTVFLGLRITPSLERCEWIIERQVILPCPDPDIPGTTDCVEWVEWCRIPGQFDWEFKEHEKEECKNKIIPSLTYKKCDYCNGAVIYDKPYKCLSCDSRFSKEEMKDNL